MGEFIKLMGAPDSLAIWPFFARELEVSFRHKFAPDLPSRSRAARRLEAPLYPRDGALRLMFGTPAARRPYLFNDLVLYQKQLAFGLQERGTVRPACVLRSAPLVPMGMARVSRTVSTRPRRPWPFPNW